VTKGKLGTRIFIATAATVFCSGLAAFGILPGTFPAQAESAQAVDLNNAGVQALNKGNFQLAIQNLEKAVKADPGYTLARQNLAIAYNNYGLQLQNNPKEAIKQFHKALFYDPTNSTTGANLDGIIRYMGKDPNSFKDRIALANEARNASPNDFIGATIEYKAALKIKDDGKTHSSLGDVYRVMEMTDPAIEEYKAATRTADSAEIEVKLGQAYQAKKDLPNAIGSYNRAIQFKSDDQDVLDALKAGWDEALKEEPLAPENHLGLGQALQYMGDFEQARAEYQQTIRLDKSGKVAPIAQRLLADLEVAKRTAAIKRHINSGVDLQTKGLFDQAIAEYNKALEADPKNAVAWVDIGSAYQQKKSYDEAIDAYKRALALDPKNATATQGIKAAQDAKQDKLVDDLTKSAADLFKIGKYDDAIAKYQEVLKQNPTDPAVHFNIGATYQAKRDLDAAITQYRQAINLDPKNDDYKKALQAAYQQKADPVVAQAVQKYNAKDYASAIDLYLQAITFLPKNAGLWYNLASAYYAREQYDKARDSYKKALDLDPKGQSDDLYLMSVIDEHYDRGQAALDGYQAYLAASPNGQFSPRAKERIKALNTNIKDTIKIKSETEIAQIKEAEDSYRKAIDLQKLQKYDEAVALYQKAINLQPKNPDYVYALGTLFQDKKEIDIAINWYKQAMELDPKNKDYPKVLQQAYVLKAGPIAAEAIKKQTSGDVAGAIALYQQAIDILPNDSGLWTNMGTALQQSDAFADARQAYEKGYNIDQKAAVGNLFLMAAIDENFRQGQKALQEYTKYLQAAPTGQYAADAKTRVAALSKNPNDTKALATSGEIKSGREAAEAYDQAVKLQQSQKYDEAIPLYEKASGLIPKEASYPYALGTVYQAKGDYDNAIAAYQRAISLDPKNKDYPKLLTQCQELKAAPLMDKAVKLHTGGDIAGAIPLYEQGLSIFPNNPRGWTNLASAYQATDNFAKAREVYQKALDMDPKGESENWYYIAALDENFGQGAKALQEYQKYISIGGQRQYAALAQQRIKALVVNPGNVQKLETQADIKKAQSASQAYDAAVKLQHESKFDEAIPQYMQAIQIAPNNASYAYALGTCYQAKGDFDSAMQWYKKASALDPKNKDYQKLLTDATVLKARPILDEAVKKHAAGDYAGAVQLYLQGLQIIPNDAHSWTNIAGAYQAMDDYTHARDAFQKGVTLDPKNEAENWYFIAAIDENFGQGPKALQEYQKYVQALPKGSYVALAQQRIAALTANPAAVQKIVTQAEQKKSSEADTAFQAAIQLQQENKFDEAIESYKKAIAVAPNNFNYWYSMGTAYQAKNDIDNAISAYTKASALNPKEPTYKQYIKQLKQAKAAPLVESAIKKQTTKDDKGNYDLPGAIVDYEAALRIDDDAGTHANLGTAYQATNNLPKALAEYKKAIQLDAKQCDAYYYLGTTYQAMKQNALAIAEYKHYLQCAPSGPNAADSKVQIKALGGK
jgi:tetratricopeptide (TPR) repeat protein